MHFLAAEFSDAAVLAIVTGVAAGVGAVWRAMVVLFRKLERQQQQLDDIEADILDCEVPACGVRIMRRIRRERRERTEPANKPARASSLLTALFTAQPKTQKPHHV